MESRETAINRAQHHADLENTKYEVWEHVGDYGRPSGDIAARHTYRVVRAGGQPGGDGWAMIAIAEPETI